MGKNFIKLTKSVQAFLDDVGALSDIATSKKLSHLHLKEYPFDLQLLSTSRLYRESRHLYLSIGGTFNPRLCSAMRALSAQDLFQNEIDFSPSHSELIWFKKKYFEVADPEDEINSLIRFNEISLFHEQNHRIIWRLLPPAPEEKRDLSRYLNFAESLVVTLDLALANELGPQISTIFERMKIIYRSSGKNKWVQKSKKEYRQFLLALMSTTYYALETIHYDDILNALDFVLPNQKKMNKEAVDQGLEISELFTRVTNPLWQKRYWKLASQRLKKIHSNSKEHPLYMPEDPLDLKEEFTLALRVFEFYGL